MSGQEWTGRYVLAVAVLSFAIGALLVLGLTR